MRNLGEKTNFSILVTAAVENFIMVDSKFIHAIELKSYACFQMHQDCLKSLVSLNNDWI